jgi:hypothetical protein
MSQLSGWSWNFISTNEIYKWGIVGGEPADRREPSLNSVASFSRLSVVILYIPKESETTWHLSNTYRSDKSTKSGRSCVAKLVNDVVLRGSCYEIESSSFILYKLLINLKGTESLGLLGFLTWITNSKCVVKFLNTWLVQNSRFTSIKYLNTSCKLKGASILKIWKVGIF